MRMCKRPLLGLALLGMLSNSALATNTQLDFAVTPIAENVYSIISPAYGRPTSENQGWNSNSHFIVTEKGVLVLDTGSSEYIGKAIIKAISSVTDKPILWVVNSHSHADHWLGNAAFADTGAEIIATPLSAKTMKLDGPTDIKAFSRMTDGATALTRMAYPTSLLTQRQRRSFDDVEVEFISANDGHSPGDIMLWLPQQKILLAGDILSADWLPIMTPRGNVNELIETLERVIKLQPGKVLTGHGNATTAAAAMRDSQFLSAVLQLVTEGHGEGKKVDDILTQVKTTLGPKYRSQYKDFDSSGEYLVQTMYEKLD